MFRLWLITLDQDDLDAPLATIRRQPWSSPDADSSAWTGQRRRSARNCELRYSLCEAGSYFTARVWQLGPSTSRRRHPRSSTPIPPRHHRRRDDVRYHFSYRPGERGIISKRAPQHDARETDEEKKRFWILKSAFIDLVRPPR